jgi:hypothetical protein
MPLFFQPRQKKIGPNISEGNKVSHPKFGKGIIIKKLGREVFRVEFKNHGTKDIHYIYLSLV